jgi:hypothetical protein
MAATILRLNAYGFRWHVMEDGNGRVFSANTKRSCLAFCRRRGLKVAS